MKILEILQASVSNCPFTRALQNIMVILFLVFPNPNFSDLSKLGLKLSDQLPGSGLLQVLPSVPSTVDNIDLMLPPGGRLHLLMTLPPRQLAPGGRKCMRSFRGCCPNPYTASTPAPLILSERNT